MFTFEKISILMIYGTSDNNNDCTLVGAVIGTYAGVLFAAKRQEKQ